MKTHILPSVKLTVVIIILCSVIYPLLIRGIAKMAPGGGDGITITHNGTITGYENIGQKFTDDKYFWSRPSAVDYNAAGSGGSNKSPSNPDYLATVQARIDSFLVHNPAIKKEDIPADMVTASGSGLDPQISIKAALIQIPRIAKSRNISISILENLIKENTEKPLLGLLGPSRINVLKLNIELDKTINK